MSEIDPPNSPIPNPIPPIKEKFCETCNQHIIIQKERIANDQFGRPRYRNVPRNALDNQIHECLTRDKYTNLTKQQKKKYHFLQSMKGVY
jgi:hypothetical protein